MESRKDAPREDAMANDTLLKTDEAPFFVGIGSSAGGLEAVSTLVQNLSQDVNAVYILAQHMSPTHKSLLTTLISRETPLPVVEMEGETTPVPNTIYITPPNTDVILEDGQLRLVSPSGHPASPKPSADRLFKSLAKEVGEHCVGVVLSGTGSDGSYGVRAIREAGGITIAQDTTTAKYDGMPASATETGCIDLTLSPEQIGVHLSKILATPRDFDQLRRLNERPSKMSDLFQILLARTNVDFRDYKENTVARRINRRMAALDVNDYEAYVAYCRTSGEEVEALYRDLLISVTRFFRDRNQFEQLQLEIEKLVDNRDADQLRLWVAGCATGEEVYSIAIMVAEAMGGLDAMHKSRVQIFATDLDDRALEVARRGSYPISAAADIPDDFLEKYFTIHEGRIEVVSQLRAVTLFSLHNIFHDPPFLNVDIVSLRNVLIYFNTSLQSRVLHRMHYSLKADGLLFLGTSETVGNMESLFEVRRGGDKIFSKRRVGFRKPPSLELDAGGFGRKASPHFKSRSEQMTRSEPDVSMFDMLARSVAPNGFIVTRGGEMVRVFGDISPLTQLTENAPLWISIRNLRKPLGDEIQGLIATAMKTKQRRAGRWHQMDGPGFSEARSVCYPLPGGQSGEDTILVALETRTRQTQVVELETLNLDEQQNYIRQMEQEVSQTRDALRQTVEELQATNEELQSINEEMQSTNEELQATNEELETSNEELQSTNEELITVNEELQVNSAELQRVSTELAATLEVVPFPLLVIDQALIVRRASQVAMAQFGIADLPQTGFHLSQCNLPPDMSTLAAICNEVFKFREARHLTFSTGRALKRLAVTPFHNQSEDVMGVVATVVDDVSASMAVDLLQRFGNLGHWQLDLTNNRLFWSDEVFALHGLPPERGVPPVDKAIEYYHPDDRAEVSDGLQKCIETGEPFEFTLRLIQADGHEVMVESAANRYCDEDGNPQRVLGVIRNVSERAENALLLGQMEILQKESGVAFFSYDLVNRSPYWSPALYDMLGHDPATFRPTLDSVIEIFHHDDRERLQTMWEDALANDAPYTFEARMVRADGRVLPCRGYGLIAKGRDGKAIRTFGRYQPIDGETQIS